ncbi:hypothetical protein PsorP6_013682 [Peronosclerospora sorghi]|uniref:Uncharacterized protein n=1 Tax=Peronosclerospora sorghi TaxID=230839 RepID=A0ACC0VIB6_9STRA|nr:hypothetical protein PsorP6_013682 [Peronosclerospora sorghi]
MKLTNDAVPALAATEQLNHQDFVDMNSEMHEYDEMREKIIKRSREILKASKQAIFALHRTDKLKAIKLLGDAENVGGLNAAQWFLNVIPELLNLTDKNPSLRDGALASSLEEYVEAKCYCYYLDTKCLLPRQNVPNVHTSEYLGGVIDFTGELMRFAVVKATARDVEEVQRCKSMVEAISGELIQFDFRNGPLRRKFDSVKYNLHKLEVNKIIPYPWLLILRISM